MGLVYLPKLTIFYHLKQPNVGKYTSPMDGMWQKKGFFGFLGNESWLKPSPGFQGAKGCRVVFLFGFQKIERPHPYNTWAQSYGAPINGRK